jgi:hypothetical protein
MYIVYGRCGGNYAFFWWRDRDQIETGILGRPRAKRALLGMWTIRIMHLPKSMLGSEPVCLAYTHCHAYN